MRGKEYKGDTGNSQQGLMRMMKHSLAERARMDAPHGCTSRGDLYTHTKGSYYTAGREQV